MNARFTHIVFDLDGTILNTLEDLARACNYVCELHGWPTFPLDAYRYKVGNGMLKLVERIMPAEYLGDEAMFAQVLAEFRARYAEHKEDHTAPYPGIIEALDSLRTADITLAVLTNKDHDAALAARRALLRTAVHGRAGRVAQPSSPKPAAPHHALRARTARCRPPGRPSSWGDSDVDVQTGHNAGLLVARRGMGLFAAQPSSKRRARISSSSTPDELIALTGV